MAPEPSMTVQSYGEMADDRPTVWQRTRTVTKRSPAGSDVAVGGVASTFSISTVSRRPATLTGAPTAPLTACCAVAGGGGAGGGGADRVSTWTAPAMAPASTAT